MRTKKRVFHCSKCDSPCEIYKKGKGHRVLVCPQCGIIASNPLPLIVGAGMALAKSGLAKKAIGAVSGLVGGKNESSPQSPSRQVIISDSLDKPNKGERYVKMALGGN